MNLSLHRISPTFGLGAIVMLVTFCRQSADGQWAQWGGPGRNFTAEATELAQSWPDEGPARLWRRALGDGYSTILVDEGKLYTMYRIAEDEFTIALNAMDGSTIWEHKNPSPFTRTMSQFGPGPHATPLIVGDRLYTVGSNGVLHCFEKGSGKVRWKHDLVNEYGGMLRARGYSCSPIAFKKTVIVAVGSNSPDGASAIAFDQATGRVIWKSPSYLATYASPILIHFDGEDQLILLMATEVVAINPENGEILWEFPHANPQSVNASSPVWDGKELLSCSSAYSGGSRVIRLKRQGGNTVPEELWHTRKMNLHHGNAVRVGDFVYGSSGDFGPAFLAAVNMRTGKLAWRKRGFSKATLVYAAPKLIILDEDGNLALATATPEDLVIHAKSKIADRLAWAAPTLVGNTLYVRDRKNIMAFDLSPD